MDYWYELPRVQTKVWPQTLPVTFIRYELEGQIKNHHFNEREKQTDRQTDRQRGLKKQMGLHTHGVSPELSLLAYANIEV